MAFSYISFGQEMTIISNIPSHFQSINIIDDYISEIGGEKKINKIKTLKKIIRIEIDGVPDFNMTNEVLYKYPNLYSSEIIIDNLGQVELIKYDGENCFITRNHNNEKIKKRIDGKFLEEKKNDFSPFPILDKKNKNMSFSIMEIQKSNNTTLYKLKIENNDKEEFWFFDKKSKFLVMKKIIDIKTIKTIEYADYTKIKGIMFPFTITSTTEMNNNTVQKTISRIQEIIINSDIKTEAFK